MYCNTCPIFKEKFGNNIRIAAPMTNCKGNMPEGCVITKIYNEAQFMADMFADAIPYDDPHYADKLNKMAISAAISIFDLDSYTNQIAAEHDKTLNK